MDSCRFRLCALFVALLFLLSGCSGAVPSSTVASSSVESAPEPTQLPAQEPDTPASAANSTVELESEEPTEIQKILEQVPRDGHNFVTERDFYQALSAILADYNIEMTPCTDGSAHFTFEYANIQDVRLLTLSAPPETVAADIAEAEQLQQEKQSALEQGNLEEAQHRGLVRDYPFDPDRDVLQSGDLVVSFLITCSSAQEDQSLFYMVSSAALAILHPEYRSDQEAFDDLKANVLTLYANNTADADYVSWIDAIQPDSSLTIPGNGIECWFGTKADRSLWLDITPYVYYEDLIDVATAIG